MTPFRFRALPLIALTTALFATAACSRGTGDSIADPAPSSSTAATRAATDKAKGASVALPNDVISEVDSSSGPAGIDARAVAGSFRGTVPCADCPGIDTTLDLRVDGTYSLSETYRERDVAARTGNGTWTAEDTGKRLRLDPNDKDDSDRLYGIASNDELLMLDQDGNAPDSALDYSLRRGKAQR